MVLNKIADGKFVFKNKQIKMAVDAEEAPEEFFFIHIKFKPSFSLEVGSSCASMLRTSCIVFIKQCHEQGLIDDKKKKKLEKYIMQENFNSGVRKEMSILEPKSSYKDGDCQSTYLRQIVSRVRLNCLLNLVILL